MSLHRWLLIAGLLGTAACQAPFGPNADCSYDKTAAAAPGYQICTQQVPDGQVPGDEIDVQP